MMRRVALAFLLAGVAQHAAAQDVELSIADGFGGQGMSFVTVSLKNRRATSFSGELVFLRDFDGGVFFSAPADLPARAERTYRFELPPMRALRVRFVADGRSLNEVSTGGVAEQGRVVLLADPPRLLSTLSTLSADIESFGGSRRTVNVNAGSVAFDEGGQAIAPRTLRGWFGVGLVVATAAELSRLSSAQLRALEDHVRSGARLLLIAPTPGDLSRPGVLPFAKDMGFDEEGEIRLGQPGDALDGTGLSRRLGFGRVWVTARDLNAPNLASAGRTSTILTAVLAPEMSPMTPRFPVFSGEEYTSFSTGREFDVLRAALDPNESFRPALWIVAALFLVYVFLVGPLNFRRVREKGRPTLALMTTPLLAFGCFVAFGLVAFMGKGVRMRYRQASFAQTVAGDSAALGRTYRGFFTTRPTTLDVPFDGFGAMAGDDTRGRYAIDTEEERLFDVRAGLWDTVFVRDEGWYDLGGAFAFDMQAGVITRVRHDTNLRILGAAIVDGGGNVFPLAELSNASAVRVPGAPAGVVTGDLPLAHSATHTLLQALAVDRDDAPLLQGALAAAGGVPPVNYFGTANYSGFPMLLVHVASPNDERAGFAQEQAISLLAVSAAPTLARALAPTAGMSLVDDALPLADEDAGEAP
ncbi:MAG: hypothetical protein AAF645_05765 [Myxococcota bacterium]